MRKRFSWRIFLFWGEISFSQSSIFGSTKRNRGRRRRIGRLRGRQEEGDRRRRRRRETTRKDEDEREPYHDARVQTRLCRTEGKEIRKKKEKEKENEGHRKEIIASKRERRRERERERERRRRRRRRS